MNVINETDLFDACKVLFGSNVKIDQKFLQYIEPAGIKSAFRKKALVTHPDRYASFSEDIQRDYAEQFRMLTSAYERLTKYLKSRDNGTVRVKSATSTAGTTQNYRRDYSTYYKDRQASSTQSGFARSYAKPAGTNNSSAQKTYTNTFSSSWNANNNDTDKDFKGRHFGQAKDFQQEQTKASAYTQTKGAASNNGQGKTYSYQSKSCKDDHAYAPPNGVTPYSYKQKILPSRQLKLGEYLYHTGIVSWKDLISALVWQSKTRQRVGEIACRWGWLTESEIVELMKNRDKGERIGDLLIRLQVITPFQRNMLVWQQQKSQKPLGEYFIAEGLINVNLLKKHIKNLKDHNVQFVAKETK
ncbi:MAG: hypothetical protein L3V56_13960 [Candidatus Magnetoovum sp. WYHC-5]|nr:hypothetical protein [Candidatus Magnetoovum sp. WYHC-5]